MIALNPCFVTFYAFAFEGSKRINNRLYLKELCGQFPLVEQLQSFGKDRKGMAFYHALCIMDGQSVYLEHIHLRWLARGF